MVLSYAQARGPNWEPEYYYGMWNRDGSRCECSDAMVCRVWECCLPLLNLSDRKLFLAKAQVPFSH